MDAAVAALRCFGLFYGAHAGAAEARVAGLDVVERADLAAALARVRLLLAPAEGGDAVVRPARTGEAAAIAGRQAVLYAASHGWGRKLEVLEAETVASFLRDFQPGREQCFVADMEGVMAGGVFLTGEGDTARLRLLHVERFARGRGVGAALVAACVRFAQDVGYAEIVLWTHTVLEPARRLYARAGFECVARADHEVFGPVVAGETWKLEVGKVGALPRTPPGSGDPGPITLG